jgi:glycosyltransferase involved in cell wall biosynthesis
MAKLSVVLPSWGREMLTLRLLNSISLQTLDDYEFFFLGDKCPVFDKIVASEDFAFFKKIIGDRMIVKNFDTHDGTSCQAINYAMKNCTGDFFMFLSNDDNIFNNHFELYYEMSAKSGKDFGLFNTSIDRGNGILELRVPELAPSKIGHSELCVSNDMVKKLPAHTRNYGHDWEFIVNAVNAGCQYQFMQNSPTYIVNLAPREHNWEAQRIV